jgi:hypothetical protein
MIGDDTVLTDEQYEHAARHLMRRFPSDEAVRQQVRDILAAIPDASEPEDSCEGAP